MKIIISGIGGRMGAEVAKLALDGFRGATLAAGVDMKDADFDCKVYHSFEDIDENADCVIDFSHHSATKALLGYCVSSRTPVVVATTGQTEEELAMIDEAAKYIPVFRSANMSLGVALLVELAKTAVKTMPDADIEIIEKHHNRKLDAPSGTALLIADAIKTVRQSAKYVFGRGGNCPRCKDDIGIHAVRMGNIVGEHEVIVGTDSQTITLRHEAHTRALFAEGALCAAQFIAGKSAGLYNMQDMIEQG